MDWKLSSRRTLFDALCTRALSCLSRKTNKAWRVYSLGEAGLDHGRDRVRRPGGSSDSPHCSALWLCPLPCPCSKIAPTVYIRTCRLERRHAILGAVPPLSLSFLKPCTDGWRSETSFLCLWFDASKRTLRGLYSKAQQSFSPANTPLRPSWVSAALGILLKCRFWFSATEMGSAILQFFLSWGWNRVDSLFLML